jgi:hypothetical protein
MPDAALVLSPFVGAAEGLQSVPISRKARFILLDQNHIRRVSASSYDSLEVEKLVALGRRSIDNIEIGDAPLEEGRVLQSEGVCAKRRHGIGPQRFGGVTMPIGVIEIEGHFYHFVTITRGV